jgi:hypothetical protein
MLVPRKIIMRNARLRLVTVRNPSADEVLTRLMVAVRHEISLSAAWLAEVPGSVYCSMFADNMVKVRR